MRLRSVLALIPVFGVLLSGCGSSGTTSLPTTSPSTNITVAISPATTQSIDAGQTVALTATVANDQGSKGVQWTVSPGGGTLAAATGLTNTYTAPAVDAINVSVTATSVADPTKSASITVNVAATPAFNTTTPLPVGYAGIVYTSALPASGGTGAKTFAVTSGTLPPGLALSSTGALTGTPTAVGTFTFAARLTDSAANPVTATATFSISIAALAINPVQLPGGIAGSAYPAATLTSSAAIGTVTYAVSGGNLPAGLTLSVAGVLSGTPTAAGSGSFTVRATDSAGQTSTASFTVVVAPRLAFANVTLPPATAGTAIPNYQLAPTGGIAPYSFALAAGSTLPTGITLTASGLLVGTPTTAGTYTFVVVATNAGSTTGGATPPRQTASATVTLQVGAFALSGGALPAAVANMAYSTTLQANGGTAPYTYALTPGSTLPAGLALNPATGVLSGTLTAAGSYNFSITVTDSAARTSTAAFTLTVASQLAFANVTLPAASTGTAIASYTFAPTGGTAPYTFALASGSTLPAGLTLSTAGVLAGTPTATGSYSFGIVATDNGSATAGSAAAPQQTATSTVTLTVSQSFFINTTTIPNIVPNSPFSFTTNVTGGTAPYTYAITGGALPAGISLNSIGKLTGTTTAALGTYNFTEQVTDANNTVTSKALTVNVSSTLSPGVNNALLNGQYAFTFTGFTNGTAASTQYGTASVGVFTFDGVGTITGTFDVNSATAGYLASQTLTNGSYSIDSTDRGTLVFTSNGQTTTLSVSVAQIASGIASQVRLLEFDDQDPNNPAELIGGGTATKQSGTFSLAALTGNYVFDLKGETGGTPTTPATSFGPATAAGYLTTNGTGTITGGSATSSTVNNSYQDSITGSYAVLDTNLGRGTMILNTLTGPANQPQNYVYYFVSPTQIYLLSTDSHANNTGNYTLFNGPARQQVAQTFSTASLSGTVIAYGSGSQHSTAATQYTTTPDQTYAGVYNVAVTSPGNVTINGYTNTNGTTGPIAQFTATYTVSSTGIVTFSTAVLPTLYLVDQNLGVGGTFPANNSGVGLLRIEPQTATALTDGTFSLASQQDTTRSYGFVGTVATANSSLTAAENVNFVTFDQPANQRIFTQTRPFNTTYTVNSTTGLIQLGPSGNNYTGYIINGGKFVTVFVDPNSQPYEPAVVFQQ